MLPGEFSIVLSDFDFLVCRIRRGLRKKINFSKEGSSNSVRTAKSHSDKWDDRTTIKPKSPPWYLKPFDECDLVCDCNKEKAKVPPTLFDQWKNGGSCKVDKANPLTGLIKPSRSTTENKAAADKKLDMEIFWNWVDRGQNAISTRQWVFPIVTFGLDLRFQKSSLEKLEADLKILGTDQIEHILVENPILDRNVKIPTAHEPSKKRPI